MSATTYDEIIYARVPGKLKAALERERQRMSRKAGAEVQTSAVIRSILERALRGKRRSEGARA